jgi:alpha-1,2-mannosyltransferase
MRSRYYASSQRAEIASLNEMKILVVHPYLKELGGAEQVFLHAVKALAEKSKSVIVLGGLPNREDFGKIANANVVDIPYGRAGFRLRKFQVYQKFFRHEFLRNKLRRKIGSVHLEVLTQDPMFLLGVGARKVAYVHYPENLWRVQGATRRFRRFWKVFYLPISLRVRQQVSKIDLLFCNSEYTKQAILAKWGRDAEVIYPPVEVESFQPGSKEDFVVTVGRFVRTKNYELVVEVAKRLPYLKFVIIGRKQSHDPYYAKIEKLKPNNLVLLPNLPTAEMRVVLGKAKLYLHTMIGEHFGISVVEAMAAGCIPIVHNSGGTKEAIGNLGYVYNTLPECVDCIYRALDSKTEPEKIAEHARMFSSENFKKSLINALKIKSFL